MSGFFSTGRTGLAGLAERLINGWALFGGLVLLIVIAANVLEVATGFARPLTGYRFSGAVEITELGAAISAFAFLPYCQLIDANVTADIFTARASARWIAIFKFAASVVALGFGILMLWRMYGGMLDQRAYDYSTTILEIPIWLAFIPILVSLALLAAASLVTLLETGQKVITGHGGH